jgi:diguanylate cyclase (GGDEF)-like protein
VTDVRTRVLERLHAAHPTAVSGLAVALVLLVGVADVLTGEELSSSVFYSFPVGLAAWFAGPRWGWLLSFAAAATWYEADLLAGATYSATWVPVWNAGVRLLFFLIIAGLLHRLRRALDGQRALAEADGLTGLPNSRRFLNALDLEVARSVRYGRPVSLAYIDLDGFKAVNDRWGHRTGDDVLRAVGQTLRGHVRVTDVPARLGGDEFAVLFPEAGPDAVRDALGKLRAALESAMRVGGWPVGFSIGVFTSSGEATTGQHLLKRADDLMYEVKHSGKGRTSYATGGDVRAPGSEPAPPGAGTA